MREVSRFNKKANHVFPRSNTILVYSRSFTCHVEYEYFLKVSKYSVLSVMDGRGPGKGPGWFQVSLNWAELIRDMQANEPQINLRDKTTEEEAFVVLGI